MTQNNALTCALILAITAHTQEQSDRATALSCYLTTGLTEEEVEACKVKSLEWIAIDEEIRR
jgi:hypothetical protein